MHIIQMNYNTWPCSGSCPRNPAPDKRKEMDGWIDTTHGNNNTMQEL